MSQRSELNTENATIKHGKLDRQLPVRIAHEIHANLRRGLTMNINHIYVGDALEVLKTLPERSVHCCVTSPPYWGLRDYGVDGQIGLEQTPEEYVERLVNVFCEVRRVLRDDGTLWLNLGDSYAAGGSGGSSPKSTLQGYTGSHVKQAIMNEKPISRRPMNGLKPKDLVGIPWRVAFALQADGWYLRSDIIWHKPNVMPESVKDRPTKAHEYIFLLSKNERYYYDADAIREPVSDVTIKRWGKGGEDTTNTKYRKDKPDTAVGNLRNGSNPFDKRGRNRRTVWTVDEKLYRLRSDLTPEQKSYVLKRLAEEGH